MARCIICGEKRYRGENGWKIGWCKNCFDHFDDSDRPLSLSNQDQNGMSRSQRSRVRSRTGLRIYYVFFGLLTIVLLIHAMTRESQFFRFLFTDKDSVISGYIDDLNGQDTDLQYRAIVELEKIGGSRAVHALIISATGDRDSNQSRIIRALGEIGGSDAIDGLIMLLKQPNELTNIDAAYALSKIGIDAYTPLNALLDSKDKSTCFFAAFTLAKIDSPIVAERLNTAFKEEDMRVIAGAADFYIKAGKPGSEPVLISALDKSGELLTAVSFLNSGNQDLSDAARSWVKKHGYKVMDSPFSGDIHAHWGENRKR